MKSIFVILLFVLPVSLKAQKQSYKGFPSLIWPKLYNISFQKSADQLGEFDKPIFTKDVLSLSGKTISLPGYMMPFVNGIKGTHFMLSSLPINACFFCGVGGPETVVEVFAKETLTYNAKPIEIRGILKLNDKDPEKMIYILEQAELIGEVGF